MTVVDMKESTISIYLCMYVVVMAYDSLDGRGRMFSTPQ